MEIHRFEKLWLVGALVLIVAFIGTIVYGALGAGVAMVDDSGGTVDPDDPTASDNFRETGVYTTDDGDVEAYVIARQYLFTPGTTNPIQVPVDTEVTFYVTSGDVTHGFHLPGTNVNTMIIPGQVSEITVEFDETGDHHIVCHEYCGVGHHNMRGTVDVVSQSTFDGDEVNDG